MTVSVYYRIVRLLKVLHFIVQGIKKMKVPTVCSIYLHCEGDQKKVRVILKS